MATGRPAGCWLTCVTHQVNLTVPDGYLTDRDFNGNRFVWVALYHPTRNWSMINQPT